MPVTGVRCSQQLHESGLSYLKTNSPIDKHCQLNPCVKPFFQEDVNLLFNPFKPEFTIAIFIHYKPRIAVAILDS